MEFGPVNFGLCAMLLLKGSFIPHLLGVSQVKQFFGTAKELAT